MEPDMRKVTFLPRPIFENFLEAAFSIALNTVNQILKRASGKICKKYYGAVKCGLARKC